MNTAGEEAGGAERLTVRKDAGRALETLEFCQHAKSRQEERFAETRVFKRVFFEDSEKRQLTLSTLLRLDATELFADEDMLPVM